MYTPVTIIGLLVDALSPVNDKGLQQGCRNGKNSKQGLNGDATTVSPDVCLFFKGHPLKGKKDKEHVQCAQCRIRFDYSGFSLGQSSGLGHQKLLLLNNVCCRELKYKEDIQHGF